ncbi:MAG: hypothetical protein V9H26_13620 [Verrucomicrobiota bacterium]
MFIRIHPWFNLVVTWKNDAIVRLCPACGLCCNGVLFGDVELQRGDDAKQLAELGVDLFRKGRKTAFSSAMFVLRRKTLRHLRRPTQAMPRI